jgi:hypothetical protein
LILAHLIRDEDYARRVLPFLKTTYFSAPATQQVYSHIESFISDYNVTPTVDALKLALEKASLSGSAYDSATAFLDEVLKVERVDSSRREWLIDQTEEFCKQRALYLAISESITLIDKGVDSAAAVPNLLKDALAVGFHTHIGHDYVEDMPLRYDMYHQDHVRIPFDLDLMNAITGGGLTPKTLNVIVAGCVHPDTPVRIRFRKKNS